MKAKPKQQSSETGVSAVDLRAEKEGWSNAHRAVRKEIARLVWHCRRHYRATMPSHERLMVRSISVQMQQALTDCYNLDELRRENALAPLYVQKFTIFDSTEPLGVMHCRALAEMRAMRDGTGRIFEPAKAGKPEESFARWTLERIRESLRDGWAPELALAIHESAIQKMAGHANPRFQIQLGETLRKHRGKPLDRGPTKWIVRAWLPLCLWQCDSYGEEAWSRCEEAAKLLNINLGEDPFVFRLKFITAWRNVRSKKFK